MGRDIKFRAWNKAENRMYQNVGIDPHAASYFVFDQDGGIIDAYGSAPTLMQCTGLKDKHGRDIYEGDIIQRSGVNIPMLVRWNEKNAEFDLAMRDPADFDRVTLFYTQFAQEYEILGNIYEHPDLIEEKS